jgi:O-methyltransferase involved in polyketide biosynthesis
MTDIMGDLPPVGRTLAVPLACRALESARPDGILRDPRAEEVYRALGGSPAFLMGVGSMDAFVAAMRCRQFDRVARGFLSTNPDGLVVDLGCGLDTRADRLADTALEWLGVDLTEVIALRRQVLPDTARSRTVPCSLFDLAWLAEVRPAGRPVIFLAEGVLPYLSTADVKPVVLAMAARFPQGELVYDAAAPWISRHHNRTSTVLKRSGTRINWDARDPEELASWGLHLLDRWGYFDEPEPRLRAWRWMTLLPIVAHATGIFHYRLS